MHKSVTSSVIQYGKSGSVRSSHQTVSGASKN